MPNRLAQEDSPYLRQHKDNPVDWWPWCDEAFERAQKENKAIFISIGYSSCHWCHVMEKRVFENQQCADILNKSFISIKVDREERPDIDKYYQEVYMLLNRRAGGWPTSIFCTPENKPFFAGTYIPPESNQGSIEGMGFIELTQLIARKVAARDPQLLENADEIENFIKQPTHPKEATVLKEEFYKTFLTQAKNNYDTRNGGFSDKPKFPHASTLHTLIVIDRLYKDRAARAMITNTLTQMKKGGMYDLVDGGFCRYSVDERWLIPHFEKMLYDNGLLCGIYTDAYLMYDDAAYLQTAREIADFWHNYMSEENLFYSASDADSEGKEGTYFVYTYDEVYEALKNAGYNDADAMCQAMNITPHGNFEYGRSVVRFEEKIPSWFTDVKPLLQTIRAKREYPFIDKKVQTSWSAMLIHALFKLGTADARYFERAKKSLDALLQTMYKEDTLFHTTLIHKEPKVEAFLEDYAFLSQALLSAYKYTQDEFYLITAHKLVNKALERFYKNGLWSFSDGEFSVKAETTDNTYTSSVSVMVESMLTLSSLLEDEKYAHFAFKTMEYNSYELGRRPLYYPYMLTQALRYLKEDRIIKSTLHNLEQNAYELAKTAYPFTLYKADKNDDFMVCGKRSCFANTDDLKELNELLSNSF